MSRAIAYLQYLALRLALCLLQSISLETYARWAPVLARICADRLRLRRSVIDENLRIAFPAQSETQQRELTRRMWEHLVLLIAEVALASRKLHETNWRQYLRPVNLQTLMRLSIDPRAKLFVSGHYGNFELSNYLMGMFGSPTLAVARDLDNEFLDRYLSTFRSRTGNRLAAKKGGYDQIQSTLAGGGIVSLLGDQYSGSKGCWVDFFGQSASTQKAIALLALEYQAPLLVGTTRRTGGPLHYDMIAQAVADPQAGGDETSGVKPLTQWFTTQLELAIRQSPEQYWWVHRRWKDNRPAKRRGGPKPPPETPGAAG